MVQKAKFSLRFWSLKITWIDGSRSPLLFERCHCAHFSTYAKIGTNQRRIAWALHKDDTQILKALHIKKKKNSAITNDISQTISPWSHSQIGEMNRSKLQVRTKDLNCWFVCVCCVHFNTYWLDSFSYPLLNEVLGFMQGTKEYLKNQNFLGNLGLCLAFEYF